MDVVDAVEPTRGQETVPSPGSRSEWGIGDALFGLLAGLVTSTLAVVAWSVVSGQTNSRSLGVLVAGSIGLWTAYVGSAWFASHRKGTGRLRIDFGFVAHWRDALVGLPVGVFCQWIVVPLVYLPFHVNSEKLNKPARDITNAAHGPGVILLVLVLVVGAPVVEELFFRGLLLRAISKRYGDRWGLVGSSVVFALMHLEALQFPALLIFGLVLGGLAVRTRRLGPSILAHALFNAVAVIALL